MDEGEGVDGEDREVLREVRRVLDPHCFYADPDPGIRIRIPGSGIQIRIQGFMTKNWKKL